MPRSVAPVGPRDRLRGMVPVALPFALVTAAWWPSTRARFGLIDDHQIVKLLAGRTRLPVSEILPQVLAHRTEPLGRSRPLYWAGQILESAWAGDRPLWWYVDRLVLVAVTLTALLYLCRLFVGPWTAAALATTAVLGPQFETWTRLGAAEAYAMPLFAVGVAACVRGWQLRSSRVNLIGTTAVLCAALAKESILVFAAAALAISFVEVRRGPASRGRWAVWGILTVAFLADVGVLAHQLAVFGSQYSQHRDVASILSQGEYVFENAVLFQGALAALLVALALARSGRIGPAARAWALCLTALLSQVVFYAGGDRVGRYLLPGTVAIMALWLAVLRTPGTGRSPRPWRPLVLVVAGVLGLSLVMGTLVSLREARANARTTRHFQAWLHALEREIVADRATVVVVQPQDAYRDLEPVLAVAQYLKADLRLPVMTTTVPVAGDARNRALARSLTEISKRGTPDGLIEPLAPASACVSVVLGSSPPVCAHSAAPLWGQAPLPRRQSRPGRPGDRFSP